jgi:hypothetical protein
MRLSVREKVKESSTADDLEKIKNEVIDFIASSKTKTEKSTDTERAWTLDVDAAILSILKSPLTYSGHLADYEALSSSIESIAQIDRLPKSNSPEVMTVIKHSWDQVDIFTYYSLRNKMIAKTSYALLLLLPATISIITIISLNRDDIISQDSLHMYVVVLSVASSFVAGVIAFVNPVTKWQQLRGAALSLESELWKFRTRTGAYSLAQARGDDYSASASADHELFSYVENLKEQVMNSATVQNSSFATQLALDRPRKVHQVYKHGQYKGAKICGTFGSARRDDDHQSPIRAAEYIKFRVEPMLTFYARRLPLYERAHSFAEIFMIVAALSGTVIAVLGVSSWVAIVTTALAGITAWAEFSSSETKMTRYSATIAQVGALLVWWGTLTAVEKSSQRKVDRLVTNCESAFQNERASWIATNMATKSINKAVETATKDKEP